MATKRSKSKQSQKVELFRYCQRFGTYVPTGDSHSKEEVELYSEDGKPVEFVDRFDREKYYQVSKNLLGEPTFVLATDFPVAAAA